jgi:steroid delta-isomerase-like uncharacterized protein
MSEQNKTAIRRIFEEAWNQGRLEVVDEVVASSFVGREPTTPGGFRGPSGYKQLIERYRTAFPDTNFTVEDQLAEGDTVITRWTTSGTQSGDMPGLPATGKRVNITGITETRFNRGKSVDEWVSWDTLGMLQQLGAAPAQ